MSNPIYSHIHNAEELLNHHRELGERLLHFGAADVDAAYMELKKDNQQLQETSQHQHAKICNLESVGSVAERRIETLQNECMVFSTREERWEVQMENKLLEERRDWAERIRELEKKSENDQRQQMEKIRKLEQELEAGHWNNENRMHEFRHEIQVQESNKYATSLNTLIGDKVRAEVENEGLNAEKVRLTSRVEELENNLRLRDLSYNVSANLGDRLEQQIVDYLQETLGFMAEVNRTHANHCGDVWVRMLEDNLTIMIDAKNASDNSVTNKPYIDRKDRNKFHQDIDSNRTHVQGAILFAKKKVHITNTVERYSPTVLFIGGGNMQDLLRGVLEVVVALRAGKSVAVEQQHHHMEMVVNSVYDIFESVGQVCAHQSDTIKEISSIADRYKTRKLPSILSFGEKLQRGLELCPQMVPSTFASQLQVGTKTTTTQKASAASAATETETVVSAETTATARPKKRKIKGTSIVDMFSEK